MPRAELEPNAEADLNEILEYTYQHFGHRQVVDYYEKINNALMALGKYPQIGKTHPQLPQHYRCFHVGAHTIIYRIHERKAQVLRIVSQLSDLDSL